MSRTAYISLSEVNELQTSIMRYVDWWVREKKTPVPLTKIIAEMTKQKINRDTVIYSLKILVKKGYIRRAWVISNKTFFVQLRRV